MIKTTASKVKVFSRTLGLVVALVVALSATKAQAAFTDSRVAQVEYSPALLLIQHTTGGVNYHAYQFAPAGCPYSVNDGDLKAWQSLAQGALLAGKTLRIYFTVCTPTGQQTSQNFINTITLFN